MHAPIFNSYCLARKATIPTSVKIHQASNSEIRTQTKVINAATGDDVMPQDIKQYQEYAGRRILLEPDEVNMLKQFNMSGKKKPKSCPPVPETVQNKIENTQIKLKLFMKLL